MEEGLRGKEIKATRGEVSRFSQLHIAVMKKVLKKYRKLFIPPSLETAKQMLTAQATDLKRYTMEAEARRINRVFISWIH